MFLITNQESIDSDFDEDANKVSSWRSEGTLGLGEAVPRVWLDSTEYNKGDVAQHWEHCVTQLDEKENRERGGGEK